MVDYKTYIFFAPLGELEGASHKNDRAVIYDVKGILDKNLSDGRL